MSVCVMDVWEMGMAVPQEHVIVLVGMRFRSVRCPGMTMLMMLVMAMAVCVGEGLV